MSEWTVPDSNNNNSDEHVLRFGECESEFVDRSSEQKLTTTCSSGSEKGIEEGIIYDSKDRFDSLREIKKDLLGKGGSKVQACFARLFKGQDFERFFDLFGINFLIEQEDNAKSLQELWGKDAWLDIKWNGASLYMHCKPFFMWDFDNDCSAQEFHLHRWSVNPAFAGCGFTLAAVEAILIAAAKLGMRACLADAIGKSNAENGYYTWVRYGFDGWLKSHDHRAFFEAAEELRTSETTLGFFFQDGEPRDPKVTKKLLELWREHGSTIVTEFLLDEASLSWRVFRDYQKSRDPYNPKVLGTIYEKHAEKMEKQMQREKEEREKQLQEEQKRKEEARELAKLNQSQNKNNNNNSDDDNNDSDWE